MATIATAVARTLGERFRCPEGMLEVPVEVDPVSQPGYFLLGSVTCYGRSSSVVPAPHVTDPLPCVNPEAITNSPAGTLPFDPGEVINNLRLERYANYPERAEGFVSRNKLLQKMYYAARPLLPFLPRLYLQRLFFRGWENITFPRWPVDVTVEKVCAETLALSMKARQTTRVPFVWFWPGGAPSCTVMTHDVETSAGLGRCEELMDLNDSFGIKSSFQIVPEDRYAVPESLLQCIHARQFEVGVHDLNHDGRLLWDREEFLRRVQRINQYARHFRANGFRAAVMYRNLDWFDALEVAYDMSAPNVAHLDPQRGGCCTVFPFSLGRVLELPVTATQDYQLFQILREYSMRLWKEQISRILQENGLISFIVHPDYIFSPPARRVYTELLDYLCRLRSDKETWIALPNEVNTWWRLRQQMSVVRDGSAWRIRGEGSHRAKLAYALLEGGRLRYELALN